MNQDTFASSEMPRALKKYLELTDHSLVLRSHTRDWIGGFFLLVFLIGWSACCGMLSWAIITQRQPFMVLFSLPFFAAEAFVGYMVLRTLFYREVLTLNASAAHFQSHMLFFSNGWQLPLHELRGFEVREVKGEDSVTYSIQLKCLGHSRTFAENGPWKGSDNQWVVQQLNVLLSRLHPESDTLQKIPEVLELLPPAGKVVKEPSDCSWKRTQELDDIYLTQRGRWLWPLIGGLLCLNGFWNGMVSVFVCGLLGLVPSESGPLKIEGPKPELFSTEWWFMFLGLIPFEIIGLALFMPLCLFLLEPLRRSRWSVHRNSLEFRVDWWGLGRSWRYEITSLKQLELRQVTEEQAKRLGSWKHLLRPWNWSFLAEDYYNLALIDAQQQELCVIDQLTLGEACWFADQILRERKHWFA